MIKIVIIILLGQFSLNGICRDKIVIGSKNFTESFILAQMLALLIEDSTNLKVEKKLGLGGTKVAFDALKNGAIDVYPDYSGTGYSMILKKKEILSPVDTYQIVKKEFTEKWGINWSKSLGFNNTYALAVRKNDARFEKIKKISQLSNKVEKLKYAAPHEFMERQDGHRGFSQSYSLNFASNNITAMQSGLMYSAIEDANVDLIIVYSTDGRIKNFNLKLLEDDKSFFPPYQVSYLVGKKVYDDIPALRKIISKLEGVISEKEMINMNYQVDFYKKSPRQVAYEFLKKKQLIDLDFKFANNTDGLFAYLKSKKQYLVKILKEHLILSFGTLFFSFIISILVGILLTRYKYLAKITFPFINTIQTIPSLALLGFLIPIFGIGTIPAIVALFLYSLLPLIRNTYVGIQSIDKDLIEAARGVGLTNFQILKLVEIPLALPVIFAGLRTASVIVIGTATLAALIGAGGLGDPIFRGVATVDSKLILLGAIPAALLAIISDKVFALIESRCVSDGIKN